MNPPPTDPKPPPNETTTSRRWVRAVITLGILGAAAVVFWRVVGQSLWSEYRQYREEATSAEDAAPVGYIGIFFRRSYNDRPSSFFTEKDGRKLLFAAKGGGNGPEYYDITESSLSLVELDGGFGRDSIPGIDAPIWQPPTGEIGRRVRDRQTCYGAVLADGPRAYPVDLFLKVEVANDRDGETPIVAVYNRATDVIQLFPRVVGGSEVTFGTTGYNLGKRPLLYDRKTRSLWIPEGESLTCFNGPSQGVRLPVHKPLTRSTWADWRSRHPGTKVLVGSERKMPEDAIPAE